MEISRILKGINYKELIGNEEVEIKDFSKDTRTINEGDIYVGIKGENFDGNTFYNKAFEAGASACLLDNIEVTEELRKYVLDNNKAIIINDTFNQFFFILYLLFFLLYINYNFFITYFQLKIKKSIIFL